jgi:hypothetical protein
MLSGEWNLDSLTQLYLDTVRDLKTMLTKNGIKSPVLQDLFLDLYNDYLHSALSAMRSGLAA